MVDLLGRKLLTSAKERERVEARRHRQRVLEFDILLRSDRRPEGKRRPHRIVERRDARLHHAHPQRAGEPFGGRRKRGHPIDTEARSEEHTSELQSLMRISYAVFCLKKKNRKKKNIK